MEIIVGKKAGFCAGVKNAVEQTKNIVEKNNVTYCLGDLVHNPIVINNLKQKGLIIINDLAEIIEPNGKQVIIRAHGVTKQVYNDAKKLNINLIDLTCPNVLAIHKIVDEFSKNGYYIFIIGEKAHPEVIGTASFANNKYFVIETQDELENAIKEANSINMQKLLIVAQTTFSLEKFENYCHIIKENIHTEIVIKNTICNATAERQNETDELSKNVDCMIIIGGKKSANTNKLYEISCKNCKNVIMIESESELVQDFNKFNKVGIMAGASTPQESIDAVKSKLNNE